MWNQVDALQKHFKKKDHVHMRLWTRLYSIHLGGKLQCGYSAEGSALTPPWIHCIAVEPKYRAMVGIEPLTLRFRVGIHTSIPLFTIYWLKGSQIISLSASTAPPPLPPPLPDCTHEPAPILRAKTPTRPKKYICLPMAKSINLPVANS